MVVMNELHYFRLNSQTNIYGLAPIHIPQEPGRFIVASRLGEVAELSFVKTAPNTKEIELTYIPGDAEIVSIASFNKVRDHRLVIGVAIVKELDKESGSKAAYLNIYQWLLQGQENSHAPHMVCQSFELDYTPYKLSHFAWETRSKTKDFVFLLSGSDNKIHIFREILPAEFREMSTTEDASLSEFLPEFNDLESPALWFDLKILADQRRIGAACCLNGDLIVTLTSEDATPIRHKMELDGPITAAHFFSYHNNLHCPSFISQVLDSQEEAKEQTQDLHLVVVVSTGLTIVYDDVLTNGLTRQMTLPGSDLADSALCCCVADMDFDGENEILVGTYGQQLLCYKRTLEEQDAFILLWRKTFPDPLFAAYTMDMLGDGVDELAVASLKGVHILQFDPMQASELALLPDEEDDIFEQLQSEVLNSTE